MEIIKNIIENAFNTVKSDNFYDSEMAMINNIPTIVNGKVLTEEQNEECIDIYRKIQSDATEEHKKDREQRKRLFWGGLIACGLAKVLLSSQNNKNQA